MNPIYTERKIVMTLIIAAVFVLIAVCVAFIRGSKRSIFRFASVLVSAVGAFVITLLAKSFVMASDQNIAQIASLANIDITEMLNAISQYSPSLSKIIGGTALSLLAPIIFFVLFITLLLITWILHFVITTLLFPVFRNKSENGGGKRIKAMIFGAAQAVIVLFLCIAPLSYYANIVDTAMPALKDSGVSSELAGSVNVSEEELDKYVSDATDDSLMKICYNAGGKAFCGFMTKFSITDAAGNKLDVNIADEIAPLIDISMNAVKLVGTPIEQFSENEAKAIEAIGDSFTASPLLKTISGELVHGLTGAWKDGNSYATIAKPTIGEPIDDVFNNLIVIFYNSSANAENLGADVKDLSKIVSVLVKSDILGSMGDTTAMVEKLQSSGATAEITLILRKNERLRPLISDVTTLSLYILADAIGVPADEEAAYTAMLNNVAAKLNSTKEMDAFARVEEIEKLLKTELHNLGAGVSDEYIASVSQAMVADFGDVDVEITPEFIAEFFTVYEEMRGDVGSETVNVSASGSYGVTKLDSTSPFTFPKYQIDESRLNSAAAVIGKLDAEIIKIVAGEDSDEVKREKLDAAVSELMTQVFDVIVEKSEDKEKAQELVKNYSDNVGKLSEKTAEEVVSASNNVASFSSSESANINCMTLGKIKDKFSASQEITDEAEAEKHSQVIEEIVNSASTLLAATKKDETTPPEGGEGTPGDGTEGGNTGSSTSTIDTIKAATQGLGNILDTLSKTELYGKNDTADLMQSILTSNTVSSVLPLTKEETETLVDKIKNDENMSYGSLMNGVSGVADLIFSITGGNCTEENVKTLITSLDESNIEAIMVLMTEERFASMGLGADKISTTQKIMSDLLRELARIEEARVETEAKAVKKLIDVALAAKAGGNGLFGAEGRIGDPTLFIEEVLASEAACNTIASTESDPFGVSGKIAEADKALFANAAKAYMGGEHEATVRDLAAVLGIELA